MDAKGRIVFAGDTSSNAEITVAQSFPSFDMVISSMKKKDVGLLASGRDYDDLLKKFLAMKKGKKCLLGKVNASHLLESSMVKSSELGVKEQVVSRSTGMYGISRKINSLQRIFSGHILRDFDVNLI